MQQSFVACMLAANWQLLSQLSGMKNKEESREKFLLSPHTNTPPGKSTSVAVTV